MAPRLGTYDTDQRLTEDRGETIGSKNTFQQKMGDIATDNKITAHESSPSRKNQQKPSEVLTIHVNQQTNEPMSNSSRYP